ncbi:MAG: hypothetical protein WC792_05210 [Candidatus Micrarchaeia archaeon]|jgi:hypothetical protein
MNIPLAAFAAALLCFAGLAAAPNCTLSASTNRPAVSETVLFYGTATPANDSYPVGGVEISRDDGKTWSGAVGTTQWRDMWVAPKAGLFVIRARAWDAANITNCTPETIDVIVGTIGAPQPTAQPLEATLATPAPTADASANETPVPEETGIFEGEFPADDFGESEFATPQPTIAPTPTAKPAKPAANATAQKAERDAIPTPYAKSGEGRGLIEGIMDFFAGIFSAITRMASA